MTTRRKRARRPLRLPSRAQVEAWLDQTEELLVHGAIFAAPLAADAPVAYLAARNIIDVYRWPGVIAWCGAIAVEAVGLVTTYTALQYRDYNATRAEGQPSAPAGLAWALTGLYFGSTLALTYLGTVPGLRAVSLVIMPVLGVVGSIVQAMRQDHRRRLAANAKAEKKAGRRLATVRVDPAPVQIVQSVSRPDTRMAVLDYLAVHPDAANAEIVRELCADGHSRSTVYDNLSRVRQNGHAITAPPSAAV
jgi:hypothetical protein